MVDLNPIVSYIVGQGAARRGEHPARVPFCIAFDTGKSISVLSF
jgi:hypothetical protein